jgi:4-diphosphocytidyl-2C-methyl-D-erythritol kinase
MNTIATELGLDFPRILRAKNVLVEAGIIQEIKDGKTSSYKVLSTNVPSELVFKHKVASEAHERTSTRRAVVAHEPNVAAGLNKSEQRQLAAAVRRFQEASTTLNSKLTQFGLIPELATA